MRTIIKTIHLFVFSMVVLSLMPKVIIIPRPPRSDNPGNPGNPDPIPCYFEGEVITNDYYYTRCAGTGSGCASVIGVPTGPSSTCNP